MSPSARKGVVWREQLIHPVTWGFHARMSSADAHCALIAEPQHGVLNRVQALAAGMTSRAIRYRVQMGRWSEPLPAVYRIGGSPKSWRQDLSAACLWLGRDAAASHRAAAVLWGLLEANHRVVEVSCERALKPLLPTIELHRPKSLPTWEITMLDGIQTTTVTRTLLDLGAVCRPWVVERALDDALRQELTDLDRLDYILRQHRAMGRNGCGVLARILESRFPGYIPTDSVLEDAFVKILKRSHLPLPVRQHPISDGAKTYHIDLAYPNEKLAIEIDSYKHHFGRVAWSYDVARSNVLVTKGWSVLRFTKDDASSPQAVVEAIDAALTALRARCNA